MNFKALLVIARWSIYYIFLIYNLNKLICYALTRLFLFLKSPTWEHFSSYWSIWIFVFSQFK